MVKRLPTMWETWVQSLDGEDPLEKEMATQYSCLENPMDGGAWWATVHGVTESVMTKQLHFHLRLWFFQWSCMDVRVGL